MAAHSVESVDAADATRYDVVYTVRGRNSLEELEQGEQGQVRTKLAEIAGSEFRDPWEWDFCRMPGRAEGRFAVGGGLRVYADIEEARSVIRIRFVGRRENLYA